MFARVLSAVPRGVEALRVQVEVDARPGSPILAVVGLPDTAVREARERVLAAIRHLGCRIETKAIVVNLSPAEERKEGALLDLAMAAGVLIAALPLVLNWGAVTRRGEPEQSLPRAVAEAMLRAVPPDGVLFVAGDNDSYPLWYAQEVLGVRRDVAVVTIPLLPTRWYRSEIARRHGLLTAEDVSRFEPQLGTAGAVAAGARRAGRPVTVSITLHPRERERLGPTWRPGGIVYVEGPAGVDTAAARRWSAWVSEKVPRTETRPAIDPVNSYFRRVLDCPRQFLEHAGSADSTRLDSACNYR